MKRTARFNENAKVTLTLGQLKKLVKESIDTVDGMTIGEFLNKIKDIYARYFPDSMCKAKLYRGLGKAITIDCYLANDTDECPNGYWENDMFSVAFWIHNLPDNAEEDSPMPKIASLTSSARSIKLEPTNDFYYYDRCRIPYRETRGSPEKCLQSFERFVKKLYDAVKEAQANGKIHKGFVDLLAEKI